MGLIAEISNAPSTDAIQTLDEYKHRLRRELIMPLCDLHRNQICSVLVLVESFDPPRTTSGDSYLMKIHGRDPTEPHNSIYIAIFRTCKESMPDIRNVGDILLLDAVKTQEFNSKLQILSGFQSRWDVLHADRSCAGLNPVFAYLRSTWSHLASPADNDAGTLAWCGVDSRTHGENPALSDESPASETAISPHSVHDSQGLQTIPMKRAFDSPADRVSYSSKRLKCVSQLHEGVFCDIVLEIVEINDDAIQRSGVTVIECLATDYSENSELLREHRSVPEGLCVEQVIKCVIWGPEVIPMMPTLTVGGVYKFRSIGARRDKFTDELILFVARDGMYPDKVIIRRMPQNSPEAVALIRRREEYHRHSRNLQRQSLQQQQKTASIEIQDHGNMHEEGETLDMHDTNRETEFLHDKKCRDAVARNPNMPKALDHGCSMAHQTLRTSIACKSACVTHLSHVINSTKMNQRYRIRVNVNQVYPEDIRSMCIPICPHCKTRINIKYRESARCNECRRKIHRAECKYEYRFMMRVYDSTDESLPEGDRTSAVVAVQGESANRLLSAAPCNLDEDEDELSRITELVKPIWSRSSGPLDLCVADLLVHGPALGPTVDAASAVQGSVIRCLCLIDTKIVVDAVGSGFSLSQ